MLVWRGVGGEEMACRDEVLYTVLLDAIREAAGDDLVVFDMRAVRLRGVHRVLAGDGSLCLLRSNRVLL